MCPACGESLQPKTHHNRCRAGRTSQPAKSAMKHRSKGSRTAHASASAKRRVCKEEPQSDAMDSTPDAIGVTTALTENVKPLPSRNTSACAALEFLDDIPQTAFLVRRYLHKLPFRHHSASPVCQCPHQHIDAQLNF